jgi:hypothetical protein
MKLMTTLSLNRSEENDMSKIGIACISFVAGICCALMLGNLPVIHAAQSQVPDTNARGRPRNVIDGVLGVGTGGGIAFGNPSPQVPPLSEFPIVKHLRLTSVKVQSLDGLDCRSCAFEDAKLVYSGGAFNLQDTHFGGNVSIEYSGAAANTIAMLELMGGLAKSEAAPIAQPTKQEPIKKTTTIKRSPKKELDFSAPFLDTK